MLYIWFLFTLPTDRLICSLWISEMPTPEALIQTCGTDVLTAYRLDVLHQGDLICSRDASMLLYIVDACELELQLHEYRFNIVEPAHQDMLDCSVTVSTPEKPTADEVKRQCPEAVFYELRYAGTREMEQPLMMCLPPIVEQPQVIATTYEFYLLAGKLIWWDLAEADCNGLAGVNPETYAATTCGMNGARPQMIAWQNGLDDSIITAANKWHVPAGTLKAMIANETQYWPWTGTDGEHGLIQITEAGAELVLHQYQPGYDRLKPAQRHEARILWLRQLDCEPCTPVMAYEHAKQVMDLYAQALAAYYCTYGDWSAALRAWNIKDQEER